MSILQPAKGELRLALTTLHSWHQSVTVNPQWCKSYVAVRHGVANLSHSRHTQINFAEAYAPTCMGKARRKAPPARAGATSDNDVWGCIALATRDAILC